MQFYCKQTYKNIPHISVAFVLAHHVCVFVCPHISDHISVVLYCVGRMCVMLCHLSIKAS